MKTKNLITGAVTGAIYAVLTIVLAPISYGPVQFRIAEALMVMPRFSKSAVPGLFIGCVVCNLLSPYGPLDAFIGGCATLVACIFARLLKEHKYLVPLPAVVINGIAVGASLHYIYGVNISLAGCMLWVALGEAAVCYLLGIPLMKLLEKYRHQLGLEE